MAFDDRVSYVPSDRPAPDFKAGLEAYEAKVQEISVDIKNKEDQLANLNSQIDQAKTALQAQYDRTVNDLGNQIEDLKSHLFELQNQFDILTGNIQERQKEYASISLDFQDKRNELDKSWADFHKSVAEYQKAKEDQENAQKKLDADQAQLASDIQAFSKFQETQLANLNARELKVNQDTENLTNLKQMNIDQLNQISAASLALDQKKIDLDKQIKDAQFLIDQASDIAKQKEQNAIDAKNNAALALQNQNDLQQIKVARVAINNKQQELSSRESMVALAEQKIGG